MYCNPSVHLEHPKSLLEQLIYKEMITEVYKLEISNALAQIANSQKLLNQHIIKYFYSLF